MKVKRRVDNKTFAVKRIKELFRSKYNTKQALREITILRKLTELKNNCYTVKLYDVLVPDDPDQFTDIFLVLSCGKFNLKDVLNKSKGNFELGHSKVILYNLLCCLKFLHSAGIMHRDFKPSNILVDGECKVKICDFGLSRTVPESL